METALPLDVPVIMDVEIGPNWGDVQEYDLTTGEYK
jgi:DNA polymerase I-like protein with 3'-5' exonuclease and polymerase domains